MFKSSCISLPAFYAEGTLTMDPALESLKDRTGTVTGLWVYTTPLRQSRLKFIKHDFLILRVSIDVKHQNSKRDLLIRAEKYNNNHVQGPGNDAGILVKLIHDIEEEDVTALFSAEDLNVTIKIADLTKILTSPDPDYDLFGDNCWKYASVGCNKLLDKFRHVEPAEDDLISNYLTKIHRPWMPLEVAQVTAAGVAVVAVGVGIGSLVVAIGRALRGGKDEEESDE